MQENADQNNSKYGHFSLSEHRLLQEELCTNIWGMPEKVNFKDICLETSKYQNLYTLNTYALLQVFDTQKSLKLESILHLC